ncbi:quaternary amine ABC transporter ATP-binding protein [Naumannella halotolerans]|uniref:Glycine betaine/proline transport system ATP-binding protein n=1 Tax=Naumannella halotolerans TaxID=993414 RepID=A0A4R7J5X4_9ACTN|nr:glycine betaine/L-proline ABC transporter ATP-binding protein [Naumannella halotolerans]TDT32761.1 glycine betaine/proline transport system ATP-binding protein [Naumannella halotolerans]
MAKVRADSVYKVFGRKEAEAVRRLRAGATRDEIAGLGTAAVIDATFEVAAGEIFVVMGLSGSGKSTLIRMLNGLWKPSAGTVEIDGTDISAISPAQLREVRRDKISMVFQHFALLPHRTVRENAAEALAIRNVPTAERNERADHWLQVVGLGGWGDKYPRQLSGGMQQRVGLARALAAETDIMLMDEAFSALDPLIRRDMQDQLLELQRDLNKTIVFITHDLNEAMYLGDRIAVMRDGRIVQIGSAEEIMTDPANDYVARFIADVDRTRVFTASSIMEKPRTIVSLKDGPRVAVKAIKDTNASTALVVDDRRRLVGQVSDAAMVQAAKEGQTDLRAHLTAVDVPTVAPYTPLSELFGPATESVTPLCVVGDDGELLGVVPRMALLASMVHQNTDTSAEPRPDADAWPSADAAPGSHGPVDPPPTAPADTEEADTEEKGV